MLRSISFSNFFLKLSEKIFEAVVSLKELPSLPGVFYVPAAEGSADNESPRPGLKKFFHLKEDKFTSY